jgi:cytidylate kinase
MTTIAMTREMGTQGRDVALGLAERLGLEIVHHELFEYEVAEGTQVPISEVHKFLEGGPPVWSRLTSNGRMLAGQTADQILELARRGNIIIRGWGAANLLRNFSHILCVRVCAPMENRKEVIMKRVGLTDRETARREIERNDAAHSRVIKKFFGGDWRDAECYDLVLNTERLSVNACIDQIVQLVLNGSYLESDATRQALSDRLVERRLRRRFYSDLNGWRTAPAVDIRVSGGQVELSGWIGKGNMREEIERLARDTAGVASVSNKLVVSNGAFDG